MAGETFAVQAVSLGKSYPNGGEELQVLKSVDLTIGRGEFVAIMGPSGSGKSTLLNLVGILDRPSAGSMRLLGKDVGQLSAKQGALARRESLGFIFQSFNLMPRLTALQNVMLPLAIAGVGRTERRARATHLLELVGLGDRLKHRPNQLSGGQKQRVAIARALALDPPILLADEPTGNLDSKTGAEIMALFARLHSEGKTIIQVTHDEEVARHAERIIRFKDGRIERIETGHARPRAWAAPPAAVEPHRSTVAATPPPAAPVDRRAPAVRQIVGPGGRSFTPVRPKWSGDYDPEVRP